MCFAIACTRIKLLWVDAQGVWLCVRRLHEGSFVWSRSNDAVCTLSPQQFAWLSAGVDWLRLSHRLEELPKAVKTTRFKAWMLAHSPNSPMSIRCAA